MSFTIRPEQTIDDAAGIDALLRAAFPEAVEADLVQRLRADGDLALSLVAEENGAIIGQVAFVPIALDPDPGYSIWGLAPISVLPHRQGQGIGSALTEAGLSQAEAAGVGLVLVLGDQNFYGRFGFDTMLADGIEVAWAGPYFAGLSLNDTAAPRGKATYPAAFADLG
ncbi:GNAT family N-acetyltransferase [Dongia sp.]|uniref:GNAT family N-acetyltransferase n=1 Tax=Dongia sp. TaxID=1977262 RepID=UPI003753B492